MGATLDSLAEVLRANYEQYWEHRLLQQNKIWSWKEEEWVPAPPQKLKPIDRPLLPSEIAAQMKKELEEL